MILKFWPRWPRKWPLNLSSLGGRPLDFNLNGIFEISGFHWSKWAIDCLIWKTFIFQIFNIQPPRLLIFITFYNRIFVVLNFEVVWPRRPRRPRKEPSEYFQRLHFWNQFVPLIKMHYRVRYSLDFDLKSRSGQGCATKNLKNLLLQIRAILGSNYTVFIKFFMLFYPKVEEQS